MYPFELIAMRGAYTRSMQVDLCESSQVANLTVFKPMDRMAHPEIVLDGRSLPLDSQVHPTVE